MGTARESQKYELVKRIPRTNEAIGLTVLSPKSAQKNAWFRFALLIRSRKYTNCILKLGTWVGAGAPRFDSWWALRDRRVRS